MKRHSLLLSIILLVSTCLHCHATDDGKISLSILSITKSVAPLDTQDGGVLELLFVNHKKTNVRIPLFRTTAPIALSQPGVRQASFPVYFAAKGYTPYPGGAFSTVDYTWYSGDGTVALRGSYKPSGQDLAIGGDKKARLFIPIQIPATHGDYKLRVRFDNRLLWSSALSHQGDDVSANEYMQRSLEVPIPISILRKKKSP